MTHFYSFLLQIYGTPTKQRHFFLLLLFFTGGDIYNYFSFTCLAPSITSADLSVAGRSRVAVHIFSVW